MQGFAGAVFSASGYAVYPYDVCRRVRLSWCVRLLCELCAEWQACGYACGLTTEVSSGGLTSRLCVLGFSGWRGETLLLHLSLGRLLRRC